MWKYPTLEGKITSGYSGSRLLPDGTTSAHKGIDFRAPEGTEIFAVDSGKVVQSETDATSGNWLIIKHSPTLASGYAHLSAKLVQVGDEIEQGQLIGLSGNTGYSFGAHLHLSALKIDSEGYHFFDPIAEGMFGGGILQAGGGPIAIALLVFLGALAMARWS